MEYRIRKCENENAQISPELNGLKRFKSTCRK